MLCHVQFSNTLLDIPASQVFHVHSDFSMEKGGFHQMNVSPLFSCLYTCHFRIGLHLYFPLSLKLFIHMEKMTWGLQDC